MPGGDARISMGIGEMPSVDAALDLCGASGGLQGSLLKVGYEKEGKCGGKFNTEAALTYGFSKKLKVFSGVCKNRAYQAMSSMDVSGASFFQKTGNCFEANLGITKIVGFNFRIGWCLAGDRIQRVFASNSFPNEGACEDWAERSKAGNDEPCTYSWIMKARL